jgi:hypothetical protein
MGIRSPCPPNAPAFCLRYSAQVCSARFSSEIDFCSFAILTALRPNRRITVVPFSHQKTSQNQVCLHPRIFAFSAAFTVGCTYNTRTWICFAVAVVQAASVPFDCSVARPYLAWV